ncbi:MAG: hypothetical protein IKZ88_10155 [Neisseriaceae bacterium]|nr:hypothetical protein [Neisseriaceae bacterium]
MKLQNTNALARLAVLIYTVCGSPPFILLNFHDDTTPIGVDKKSSIFYWIATI